MPIVAPATETSPLGTIHVAATPPGFVLFYTGTDFDGRLSGDTTATLRSLVAAQLGRPVSLSTCHQVHGTRAAAYRSVVGGWCEEAECDALWSNVRGAALGIKVADCLPVTLIDPGASAVGNIHSGWRGAAARIVDGTFEQLEASSNFAPTRAHAFLGPSIRTCCFQVGEEVVDAFIRAFGSDVEAWVDRSRGERPYLDLVGVTSDVLEKRGIHPGSIIDSGICTRCDTRFHSYRRNGANAGRNLAIAAH